jgi:hypothetical protein
MRQPHGSTFDGSGSRVAGARFRRLLHARTPRLRTGQLSSSLAASGFDTGRPWSDRRFEPLALPGRTEISNQFRTAKALENDAFSRAY